MKNFDFKKETYVDKIVEIIEYRIISGKLKPNEKISEKILAKEFNVSRGPTREALLRLEDMDLVLKNHNGRMVKEFDINEFRENYELKIIAEAYCCMQGAYRATEQEVSNIRNILEKIRSLINSKEYKKRFLLNSKYHEALVHCARNNKLEAIYKTQIKKFNWSKCFPTLKFPRAEKAFEEHLEIFNAFANKEGENVRKLTEKHQNNVLEIMMKNFYNRYDDVVV